MMFGLILLASDTFLLLSGLSTRSLSFSTSARSSQEALLPHRDSSHNGTLEPLERASKGRLKRASKGRLKGGLKGLLGASRALRA